MIGELPVYAAIAVLGAPFWLPAICAIMTTGQSAPGFFRNSWSLRAVRFIVLLAVPVAGSTRWPAS